MNRLIGLVSVLWANFYVFLMSWSLASLTGSLFLNLFGASAAGAGATAAGAAGAAGAAAGAAGAAGATAVPSSSFLSVSKWVLLYNPILS